MEGTSGEGEEKGAAWASITVLILSGYKCSGWIAEMEGEERGEIGTSVCVCREGGVSSLSRVVF